VEQKHAESMVKEMQTALKSSTSDQAMIKVLEDDITKHITDVFGAEMEQTYKSTFKKGLKGELDAPWSKELKEAVETQSKKLGKDVSKFTDELTEAAWKGAREGIEDATRLAVREGLERAFKKFRENKHRGAAFGASVAGIHGGFEGRVGEGGIVAHDGGGKSDEERSGGRGERVTEFQTSETDASGEHVQVYERNEVTGKVRKTGDRIITRNKAA
jgi:DNA-binding ferritin-like protein (Dps family)